MNVVVFCSAQDVDESYRKEAFALGEAIARAGHTLVWGGSNMGLMKDIADSVQENGGKLIGVTIKDIEYRLRKYINEVHVMNDLSERKKKIEELGDVFIALPGGIGTLDELTHVAANIASRRHASIMHLLNTNGFYKNFYDQLLQMEISGFISRPLPEIIQLSDTVEELIAKF